MTRPAGPGSPLWRRWTNAVLLATAVALPLIFDMQSIDAFARAKLAVLHLLVPLAAAGAVVGLATGDVRWRARPRVPDLAVAAFAVLAVLSTVLAPSPSHSLEGEQLQYQGLVTLLMYAAAYFVARVALDDATALRRFFLALTVASAVVAAYGLVQQLQLDPIWHVLDKGRIFSTLGQANNLAAFLVLCVPCIGAAAVLGGRVARAFAVAALVVSFAALGLTLSRGGYLGLVAAGVVMAAALAPSIRIDPRGVRVAVGAVALAVLLVVAVPPIRQQAQRIADRVASTVDEGQSSVRSHLDLWAVGVRMSIDHPLIGTGPDSYVLEFASYRDRVLPRDRAAVLARFRPESPHDVYLAYSSGLGIPALLVYLSLIALALWRVVRSVRATAGPIRIVGVALLGAITAHLVSDTFMTAELTGSWLFWTFLGAAVSLPIVEKVTGPGRAT